jgi:hypothetical protein
MGGEHPINQHSVSKTDDDDDGCTKNRSFFCKPIKKKTYRFSSLTKNKT